MLATTSYSGPTTRQNDQSPSLNHAAMFDRKVRTIASLPYSNDYTDAPALTPNKLFGSNSIDHFDTVQMQRSSRPNGRPDKNSVPRQSVNMTSEFPDLRLSGLQTFDPLAMAATLEKITSQSSIDLPQLVRLLQFPDPQVEANAAAYLQHLVFRNPVMKEKARQCGAIAALVHLLYSNHLRVYLNAVGVLRNLTCGENLEIKEELERVGGIRALAWLIENRQVYEHHYQPWDEQDKSTPQPTPVRLINEAATKRAQPAIDTASAVLCNLASCQRLKRSVLQEALLPSLVDSVIKPVAAKLTHETYAASKGSTPPFATIFFKNIAAMVRNVSSSDEEQVRTQMRVCPALLPSILTILHIAVRDDFADLKSVEHCVCIVRNLCFALHQTLSPVETPRLTKSFPSSSSIQEQNDISPGDSKLGGRRLRLPSFGRKRSGIVSAPTDIEETSSGAVEPNATLFWQPNTIATLLTILRTSSNPSTIEAAAGALQNLTAGNWTPSHRVRHQIRIQHGLPILVELLRAPVHRVVIATATALRNMAAESRSCELLGKHGLAVILDSLHTHRVGNDSSATTDEQSQDSEWCPAHLSTNSHTQNNSLINQVELAPTQLHRAQPTQQIANSALADQTLAVLLSLCFAIINDRPEHARRFVALGGVEQCRELSHRSSPPSDASQKKKMNSVNIRSDPDQVECFAQQLLQLMWCFNELRPIYKLAGWTEKDFCLPKRGRFASLIRRKGGSQTRSRPVIRRSASFGTTLVDPTQAASNTSLRESTHHSHSKEQKPEQSPSRRKQKKQLSPSETNHKSLTKGRSHSRSQLSHIAQAVSDRKSNGRVNDGLANSSPEHLSQLLVGNSTPIEKHVDYFRTSSHPNRISRSCDKSYLISPDENRISQCLEGEDIAGLCFDYNDIQQRTSIPERRHYQPVITRSRTEPAHSQSHKRLTQQADRVNPSAVPPFGQRILPDSGDCEYANVLRTDSWV